MAFLFLFVITIHELTSRKKPQKTHLYLKWTIELLAMLAGHQRWSLGEHLIITITLERKSSTFKGEGKLITH